MSSQKPDSGIGNDKPQAAPVLNKKQGEAVIWQVGELDKKFNSVLANIDTLQSKVQQACNLALDDVKREQIKLMETYTQLMSQINDLKKNGLKIDNETNETLNDINKTIKHLTTNEFLRDLYNATWQEAEDNKDFISRVQSVEQAIRQARQGLYDDVSNAVDAHLQDFYQNAENFTNNVKDSVTKATAQMDADRDEQVNKMSEAMDKLISAKVQRLESRVTHILQTEEMLRDWKLWVKTIIAAVTMVGFSLIILSVSKCSDASTAQKQLQQYQQDANYWRTFRAKNPKSSAKFEKETDIEQGRRYPDLDSN